MVEKTFACSIEGLAAAQEFLERHQGAPKPSIVLDEVASNLVRCSGATEFSVALDLTDDGLCMRFSDNGRAFDPTREIDAPDVTASLEDRKIGGLGMFMVRRLSKSVAYARENGRNILTIVV